MQPQPVARWNLRVSPAIDRSVRTLLALNGARKGDLSNFVEAAVREYVLERSVERMRTGVDDLDDTQKAELIEEAVQWARKKT